MTGPKAWGLPTIDATEGYWGMRLSITRTVWIRFVILFLLWISVDGQAKVQSFPAAEQAEFAAAGQNPDQRERISRVYLREALADQGITPEQALSVYKQMKLYGTASPGLIKEALEHPMRLEGLTETVKKDREVAGKEILRYLRALADGESEAAAGWRKRADGTVGAMAYRATNELKILEKLDGSIEQAYANAQNFLSSGQEGLAKKEMESAGRMMAQRQSLSRAIKARFLEVEIEIPDPPSTNESLAASFPRTFASEAVRRCTSLLNGLKSVVHYP